MSLSMVDWVVNRMHVSTSDRDLIREFWRRYQKAIAELGIQATREERKLVYRRALETHHKNQGLYRAVVTGDFGDAQNG